MKKVFFIVNYNLYESKIHFTTKLAEAFERQGVKSFIIEVKNSLLSKSDIEKIWKEKPDITLSFNTLLPLDNGLYLWDILKIPHLSILVDPVIYVMHLLKSPYSLISSVDQFDIDLLKKRGFERAIFLPHGVERELALEKEKKKIYDVVLIGSCYDYEALKKEWESFFNQSFCKVIEKAVELTIQNPYMHFIEATAKSIDYYKVLPKPYELEKILFYVDNYVRGYDRVNLIRSIKEVDLHIFGGVWECDVMEKGWEYYLRGKKDVTIHPPVGFAQSMEILKQAKIVLSSNPFFKQGSHERLFTALSCNACVITSQNRFVDDFFGREKGIYQYKLTDHQQANEIVHTLLSDEKSLFTKAQQGKQIVLENHTWDSRAKQIQKELAPILKKLRFIK